MQEQIDLVVVAAEKRKTGGLSIAVIVSFVLHTGLIVFFVTRPEPEITTAPKTQMARYVELIKQNPREFVEAPGPKLEQAPSLSAPLSDANRKASTPQPTGMTPTNRPGDGSGLYTPPVGNPAPRSQQPQQQARPEQQPQQARQPQMAQAGTQRSSTPAQNLPEDTFAYRETNRASAAAAAPVDLRKALAAISRQPVGGGEGLPDLSGAGGGEKGLAEQGPLSFETQWYDWGPYAQSMVSKIRVHWYANMPQLIRSGIGGVVTIRFTIQRDGRITDIIVLESSGHPPYDFAARKAIELSSPLNALPKDFPNPTERVTAVFYYNTPIKR